MYKLVTFAGYDNRTGPHIFPIEPDVDRTIGHIKMARPLPPEIEHYIRSAEAIAGKTQLLIDAMGAGEYYGCFPAGTLIRTQRGDLSIEEVCVDDLVLTHLNRWRRVARTFVRPHDGEIISLYTAGNSRTEPAIAATPNHEFWIVTRETMVRIRRRIMYKRNSAVSRKDARAEMVKALCFDWVPLCEIRNGDYLAEPFPLSEDSPLQEEVGTNDFAFLMGLYAAEGCTAKRYDREQSDPTCKIVWVVGANEKSTIKKVHEVCARLGHSVREKTIGNAVRLEVNWAYLARLCRDHIGTHSLRKQLSHALLTMPRGWQEQFFSAYQDGDGCIRTAGKGRGAIRCVTASRNLARSLRRMLARLGWIAQIDGRHNRQSNFYANRPIYTVTISATQVQQNACNVEGYLHPDGYILSPVRRISSEECSVDVFNLEVEDDNSYVARGYAVHNSNVNGDVFPEEALAHKGADYGHETFMHYAYPYLHHANKDPARAYGEKVTLAAYDTHMHRVLLIVRADNSRCQDILGDLARGHYWDVSMGAKVPFDICSICKNRARNRGEYCTHLRYQMNKILNDGRRVCAINTRPKFFDISFVTIGAEKASHILQKVAARQVGLGLVENIRPSSAELGADYYAKLALADKRAAQKKRAEIEKDVPSQPPANVQGATPEDKAKLKSLMADAGVVKATEPSIPNETLDDVSRFPLKQVFSTLGAMGIDLRPHEFQRIILVKQGAVELARALERNRLVFDEYRPGTSIPKWAHEFSRFEPSAVNEKVAMAMRPYLASRSCYPEILLERLQRMEKQGAPYSPGSQWYPMTDEQRRQASGIHGLVPASVALAAGFLVFRRAFPGLVMKGPAPVRALAKHPWLLPMLIGAGVGASVGLQTMKGPRPILPYGTGAGLDGKKAPAYHGSKTASVRVGDVSLAYVHAGTQQTPCRRNDQAAWFERVASVRPELLKQASSFLDITPAIIHSIRRIAATKENSHAHYR